MTDKKEFKEFKKLYKCVSSLVRCRGYIPDKMGQEAIDSIMKLAKNMEAADYIRHRNMIAVAGMQGSGKSTLIRNFYNIPDDILNICVERGEKIPVFISESKELGDKEYRAKRVYFDEGYGRAEEDIDPFDIAKKSRDKNNIYLELFVPTKYFDSDGRGFALLPGFEKNSAHTFDDEYNSIIEYTLHFSSAVLLAVDNLTLASGDISTLLDILGKNFSEKNCVFAITKCEGKNEETQIELKEALVEECEKNGFFTVLSRIVCTGNSFDPENNEKWINELTDAISDVVDVDADKKEYLYYKPMVDELIRCANVLSASVEIGTYENVLEHPLVSELRTALYKVRDSFAEKLDVVCNNASKKAKDNFYEIWDKIPYRFKKPKKFLLFNKKGGRLNADSEAILGRLDACFENDGNPPKSNLFISELKGHLLSDDNKNKIKQAYKASYELSSGKVLQIDKMLHGGGDIGYADFGDACNLIAQEFEIIFISGFNDIQYQKPDYNTDVLYEVMDSSQRQGGGGFNFAKTVGVLDMLDGHPDILNSVSGIFKKKNTSGGNSDSSNSDSSNSDSGKSDGGESSGGESSGGESSGGAIASAASPYIAGAIIAAWVIKKGIDRYNKSVLQQNEIAHCYLNMVLNAVQGYRNQCLESFEDGIDRFIDYVRHCLNKRFGVGEKQAALLNAQGAIADVRVLVNSINAKYADSLDAKYGN